MRELAFFFKEEDFDEKKERKKESERDFEKKGRRIVADHHLSRRMCVRPY